jgi:hypothetical protein
MNYIFSYVLNNNSIQFFIIYMQSQQPQGQLQTQHSVHVSNYNVEQYNMKSSAGENTH